MTEEANLDPFFQDVGERRITQAALSAMILQYRLAVDGGAWRAQRLDKKLMWVAGFDTTGL